MDSQVLHVMTISNSIIGVSLLAMPYCFKQCGIILSIIILIASSLISRLSCHLLLKSAIIARRKTFEVLAFHTFGSLGKFMTELGIIGFLIGTCIAFFVIMGDLGPTIVAKMTGTSSSDTMRTSILMALALFCVLPLGLLRNVDSLSSVCTATVGFYFCLVVKIISEAVPHLFKGDWIDKVELWRPSGILQCLPIFSMALSCQTQIFEIYQVVQNASLEKMNNLIRVAINICCCVYIFVGTFGYIAFCNQTFTGNILMSFSSTFLSDAIKMGFVLSVAFSFPLVIFPCRASLNSLLYKQAYSLHEGTDKYIPEGRFKAITFVIILIPLVIGIMIPNIEIVLGLMGSTIGIMICVIFPATCFICTSTKNSNERMLAQIMLFFGILIMVLGTYANLFTLEERQSSAVVLENIKIKENIPKVVDIPLETKLPNTLKNIDKLEIPDVIEKAPDLLKQFNKETDIIRHEPPEPQEPSDNDVKKSPEKMLDQKLEDLKVDLQKNGMETQIKDINLPEAAENKQALPQSAEILETKIENEKPKQINKQEKLETQKLILEQELPKNRLEDISDKKVSDELPPLKVDEIRHEPPQPVEPVESNMLENKAQPANNLMDNNPAQTKKSDKTNIDSKTLEVDKPKENLAKLEDPDKQAVDIEAIKKEDKELLEQEKAELTEEEKKNLELLKTLEKQNKEQQKLVEESKKVLEEIKQRQHILEEKKQKVMEKEKQVLLKNENSLEVANNKPTTSNKSNSETVVKEQSSPDIKLNKGNLLSVPNVANANSKGASVKDVQLDTSKQLKQVKEVEQDINLIPHSTDKTKLPENQKEQEINSQNKEPDLHREIRSINPVNLEDSKGVCDMCDKEKKNIQIEESPIKTHMKLQEPDADIKEILHDISGKVDSEVVKMRDLKSYS